METQDDEKLIQGFDKNQNLEDDLNTKSSGTLKIVLIILGVIVVLAVIAIVLYYTVFKKSSNDDSGDKAMKKMKLIKPYSIQFLKKKWTMHEKPFNNYNSQILSIVV